MTSHTTEDCADSLSVLAAQIQPRYARLCSSARSFHQLCSSISPHRRTFTSLCAQATAQARQLSVNAEHLAELADIAAEFAHLCVSRARRFRRHARRARSSAHTTSVRPRHPTSP